jgi:signal transduction histidine kinase
MLLGSLSYRNATLIRLIGLGLISWAVIASDPAPATGGRGLVVLIGFVVGFGAWLVWTFWSCRLERITPDLYVLAACGGVVAAASPESAGSAFTFVAVTAAAARTGLPNGLLVAALGAAVLGGCAIIYDHSALGVLAYTIGFAAAALAGSNIRQTQLRIEQTQLLLAQTQRSHEEQLRAARLEESTRIARDIHDVLAHSLAALAIQLEATDALLAQGAENEVIRERVRRAHALALEGLNDTRRAVGALRGDRLVAAGEAVGQLVEAYDGPIDYVEKGELGRLSDAGAETLIRAVQEALTNVRKHAPGAHVDVRVEVGDDELRLLITDRPMAPVAEATDATALGLVAAGGGYGLTGMRERAAQMGGTLAVGPRDGGWRVDLRLPVGEST